MSDLDFRRPSPKLWTARLVVWAAGSLAVLVIAAVVATEVGDARVATVTAAVVLALAGWVYVVLRGRYRSWGYLERDDDLVVRRGLLLRRLTVVPYGRMQFVDVTAGPVERWFGLATVQLHTAAAATDAQIPGLASAEAARLRDRLVTLGEARAAGL